MSHVQKDTSISVCIARVFKNISKKRINAALTTLALGDIERIDLVSSKNSQFNTAFIHYHRWNNSQMDVFEAIKAGRQVKVIYEEPWYWLLSQSRSPKPEFKAKNTPKIIIGSDAAATAEAAPTFSTASLAHECVRPEAAASPAEAAAHDEAAAAAASALLMMKRSKV